MWSIRAFYPIAWLGKKRLHKVKLPIIKGNANLTIKKICNTIHASRTWATTFWPKHKLCFLANFHSSSVRFEIIGIENIFVYSHKIFGHLIYHLLVIRIT